LVFSCAFGISCDEKLSNVTGPTPNLTVTFSSINQNILAAADSAGRSNCTLCHAGPTPAGGLNLATDPYNALVNRPSTRRPGEILVIPGDAENSYLYKKLHYDTGSPEITGSRMPRNGPPYLTEGQIEVIERWINQGAKNN
jgi:hypothetical protein